MLLTAHRRQAGIPGLKEEKNGGGCRGRRLFFGSHLKWERVVSVRETLALDF